MDKNNKNQRRRPKQARAIAKYNAVLDACAQVLATHGYQKATILELSLSCDVPVSTIYQYFDDKESIFIAWFDRTLDSLFSDILTSHSTEGRDDLERFVNDIIALALEMISTQRESVRRLIVDLPHVLLSHLLVEAEEKTTQAALEISKSYLGDLPSELLIDRLRILVRCLTGFIIQYVLDERHQRATSEISDELSALAVPYLANALLHNDSESCS